MVATGRELLIIAPDGASRTIRLEGDRLSLGRSSANELSYPADAGLSRQHLMLEREGDEWTVRDLGSKNGTLVNGVRTSGKHRLRPGDRISASRVVLVYDAGPETASDRTVIFEAPKADVSATVTTSLGLVLSSAAGGKPVRARAAGWADPVTVLMRAGRELAARQSTPQLYETILNLCIEAVVAERGVLMTLEGDRLVVQASRGENFRLSSAVRDRVLLERSSLLVENALDDRAFRERQSIVAHSVHSFMAVPLQTDDRVIGLIYVDSPSMLRQFSGEDLDLLTVMANVAAIRIERERLAEVEQARQLLANEMEQAAEIQREFLPVRAPVIEGFELAGYNAPCRSVGGDYYDFLQYPDGRLAILVGDVAGKGMPAALLMMNLQARVQVLTESAEGPGALMSRLNRILATHCPRNRFISFFLGVAEPSSRELVYSNGGHNPPLLVRTDGRMERLEGGGPVLAILPGILYEEYRCRFDSGDLLVLYSDGVTEATDPAGEEFGEDRLAEIVCRRRHEPAQKLVEAVNAAVEAWTAGGLAADDITLVVARRA